MSGLLYDGWMILAALLPSIGLLFLFWVILKHIIEGDRRERAALREWDRTHPEKKAEGKAPVGDGATTGSNRTEPTDRS